jgi:hypothetical protein
MEILAVHLIHTTDDIAVLTEEYCNEIALPWTLVQNLQDRLKKLDRMAKSKPFDAWDNLERQKSIAARTAPQALGEALKAPHILNNPSKFDRMLEDASTASGLTSGRGMNGGIHARSYPASQTDAGSEVNIGHHSGGHHTDGHHSGDANMDVTRWQGRSGQSDITFMAPVPSATSSPVTQGTEPMLGSRGYWDNQIRAAQSESVRSPGRPTPFQEDNHSFETNLGQSVRSQGRRTPPGLYDAQSAIDDEFEGTRPHTPRTEPPPRTDFPFVRDAPRDQDNLRDAWRQETDLVFGPSSPQRARSQGSEPLRPRQPDPRSHPMLMRPMPHEITRIGEPVSAANHDMDMIRAGNHRVNHSNPEHDDVNQQIGRVQQMIDELRTHRAEEEMEMQMRMEQVFAKEVETRVNKLLGKFVA